MLEAFGTMVVAKRPVSDPAPHEAMVRTIATGICGSDLHGFTGHNGRRFPGQVMGHESVGRVVGYGSEVDPRTVPQLGAAVTFNPTISCGACPACDSDLAQICLSRQVIGVNEEISAAFAEYVTVPATNLVALPQNMPAHHGALVEPLAVGYHAGIRGGVHGGSTVLVIGAGPIGQAAILAAQRLGAARVLVSEPAQSRRQLSTALGAELLPTGDQVDAALELTEGLGVDVVIDAVGYSKTLDTSLRSVRRGGVVVLVGMGSPSIELEAFRISTDERSVVGAFCYSTLEFEQTVEWAATVPDQLETLISTRVPLHEGPGAFRRLADGKSDESKVLVIFHND
ncbi:alcohol dehydrogenase catalytic domain-containing protein [Microbacterium sp. NPDC076911]|uniref:zinc-dependent alcohol dehydrogenase n=1 Tax=Microbacterium sp. NPDC076911 TaxID=3154958 RepID=UPI0034434F7E